MPVNARAATSPNRLPGKNRVSRNDSHDNIAKLNRMNKSLQKSYYQDKTAFRPSGAIKANFSPTQSELKERKEAFKFRSTNNDLADSNEFSASSTSPDRTRRSGSEYTEKFIPWEYEQKQQTLSPERKYSSLYNFNVDMNVAGWESENHRSFKPQYSQFQQDDSRAAGVSTHRVNDSIPASLAWDGNNKQNNDMRAALRESKVNWPSKADRIVYTNPDKQLASIDGNFKNTDTVHMKYDNEENYSTADHTDENYAPSVNESDIAKKDKNLLYSVGDSEYRSSFVKFPVRNKEQLKEAAEKKWKERSSKAFGMDLENDAYKNLRSTTEYQSNYNRHGNSDAGDSRENTLSDSLPPPPPPLEDSRVFNRANTNNNNNDQRTVHFPEAYRETQSEYVREYNWPPLEAFHSSATHIAENPNSTELEKSLRFDHTENASSMKQLRSEYKDQYFDVSQFVDMAHPNVATKKVDTNPPQFAWPLVDGEPQKPRNDSPKRQEFSEHTAKFRWPAMEAPVQNMSPNKRQSLQNTAPAFAVDNQHYNPLQWQSEYEDKCAQLRRRQYELNRPVAGVVTQRVDNVPVNFAWDGKSKTPAPADYQPTHSDPEHFRTEYLDNFLKYRVQDPTIKVKPEVDQLNLFEGDNKENNKSANRLQQLRSEYQDNFKKVSLDLSKNDFNYPNKTDDGKAPPQFAWPLVDQPVPKAPPSKPANSKPFEKTEYKSHFVWPPVPPAPEIKKPEDHNPPMGTDPEDSDVAKWKSEYDARTEEVTDNNPKIVKKATPAQPSAGIVTINADDVPTFFAWADAEEAKKPTKIIVKTFHNPEKIDSEAHAAFKPHPGAIIAQKFHEQDTLNLFDGSKATSKETFSTEYEKNFKKFPNVPSPTSIAEPPAGVQNQATAHPEYNRPPQFAWSLLNGEENNETLLPPPPPAAGPHIPFTETTEYESRFKWQPDAYKRQPKDKNEFKSSLQVIGSQNGDEKDWQSEYENRCIDLRKRQQQLAVEETARRQKESTFIAGVKTATDEQAPAFYAWSALNGSASNEGKSMNNKYYYPPVADPTNGTEYSENFHAFDAAGPANTTKRNENTKSHIFPSNTNRFDANTEYTEQFNTVNSLETTLPVNPVVEQQKFLKYGPSLRNTNLDRTSRAAQQSSPARLRSSGTAGLKLSTEYRTQFDWPDNIPAEHHQLDKQLHVPVPGGSGTHHINERSSAQFAVNPVGTAMRSLSTSTVNRLKDLVHEPIETVDAAKLKKASQLPLTETQERFAWPGTQGEAQPEKESQKVKASKKKSVVSSSTVSATLKSKHFHDALANGKRPWNYARPAPVPAHAQEQLSPQGTPQRGTGSDRKKQYRLMGASNKNGGSNPASPTTHDDEGFPVGDHQEAGSVRFNPSRTAYFHSRQLPADETDHSYTDSARQPNEARTVMSNTLMSQDSLNIVPSTNTVATTTTRSSSSTSYNVASSSRPRSALTGDDVTISSAGQGGSVGSNNNNNNNNNNSSPEGTGKRNQLNSINDEWKINYIPGLRSPEQEYRSRSAPPRRMISSDFDRSLRRGMYVDESNSNPVLLHRRYPEVSDRQTSRWSTETRDSFKWKQTGN